MVREFHEPFYLRSSVPPTHAYSSTGDKVWERELDIYGAVRTIKGDKNLIPQLYQGQWVDSETGLAYNRFRYYDSESGGYISQDPIRLGGGTALYGYVKDSNCWIDAFGLQRLPRNAGHWDGAPGNSNWFSDNPKVTGITGGEGVPFKDGHADFSKWSEGSMEFDNLTGGKKDFDIVHEQLKTDLNLNSNNAAKNFLKDNGLTAHHHQDMRTIEFIPSDLHNNVPHEGGASKLRKVSGEHH